MKSVFSVMVAAVLALHVSWVAAASVQVASLKGSLTGRAPGAAEAPLRQGDVIGSGWVVNTGADSYTVLRFDDGQVVALQSRSTFRIDSYKYEQASPGTGEVLLSLLKGGVRAITGLVAKSNQSAFALRTSTATIGIRGSDFLIVDFAGNYGQVLDGSISVTTAKGSEVFSAGQTMHAASATAAATSIPASAVPAGLFNELLAIPVAAAAAASAGGASAGAGAATGGAVTTTAGAAAFVGVAAAGVAAAIGGGGDGGVTTTHHH